MRTLRLTQTRLQDGQHHVRITLDGDGAPLEAATRFPFEVSPQDREDLRWYLEDFLEYPLDPAPTIAARVEHRMAELGRELFTSIFGGQDAAYLWAQVAEHLAETRIEVSSEVEADVVLPWELLWGPRTDTPLAVGANTFVRTQHQTAKRARLPQPGDEERIRVLLVISRPAGELDVPFRSVASHLVRLSAEAREIFQLDVLRPATFRRLAEVLREAADHEKPYHVVHFDGHGTWADLGSGGGGVAVPPGGLRYSLLSPPRPGAHGYLLFEDPTTQDNQQLVDGPALGRLLTETGVPVLVLNACQSAHADLATAPKDVEAADAHERVRAYGSLAQEIVDAGVAGVVAMRYSVYVVTAAQFVGDLYKSLLQGHPLGTAVTRGRKQLREQPNREIAFEPRPLQDWVVPVVYEAATVRLFPEERGSERQPLRLELSEERAGRERGSVDSSLPAPPDAGFYGRDETLLALDRAFDTHQIVLLHAYAGAGKTSTAAEFARWYMLTGGVTGPVLFTSFERPRTLPQVVDQFGQAFELQLEAQGIQWLTLSDAKRRAVATGILRHVPVLWIWDNIEPITGFPVGTLSEWSQAEQDDLLSFLREIRSTKAKVLLTSRRDERTWLGELPARIALPPMRMAERVQLARALAEKRGHRLTEVEDWRPLLEYTQGNPLTLTVLVGQALRDGVHTRQQIREFVGRLRAGEADLDDDITQGRSQSLGASLAYGISHAFTVKERQVLALLYLFQGHVNAYTLWLMGQPEIVGGSAVPSVRNQTRGEAISLLDRVAEIGLLTAYGEGIYGVHPALPWYLEDLFVQSIGPLTSSAGLAAQHAYATAIAELGAYYHNLYEQHGLAETIILLRAEEANLLQAWRIARDNRWCDEVTSAMQGLRTLYTHTGRQIAWARLVHEVAPEFTDPATDRPRSGREEGWRLVTDYRIGLAVKARDWPTARRLQDLLVAWTRQQAGAALAADPATLDIHQRNQIRDLAAALQTLGQLVAEQQQPRCLNVYEEVLALMRRIGDRRGEASTALALGAAYLDLKEARDFDKAEHWYHHSRSLYEEDDQLGQAYCTSLLALVQYRRYLEALAADRPEFERLTYLRAAAAARQEVLALTPGDAVGLLADTHRQLGLIYDAMEDLSRTRHHHQRAIRFYEAGGDLYGAAQSRFGLALALADRERLEEALEWARAALNDFESYGDRAADKVTAAQELIDLIQQVNASDGP